MCSGGVETCCRASTSLSSCRMPQKPKSNKKKKKVKAAKADAHEEVRRRPRARISPSLFWGFRAQEAAAGGPAIYAGHSRGVPARTPSRAGASRACRAGRRRQQTRAADAEQHLKWSRGLRACTVLLRMPLTSFGCASTPLCTLDGRRRMLRHQRERQPARRSGSHDRRSNVRAPPHPSPQETAPS